MAALVSRAVSSVGLVCLLVSVGGFDYDPCLDRSLIFGAQYDGPSDQFAAHATLDVMYPAIRIRNETVSYPYPRILTDDVSVEVDFLRRQRNFTRLLRDSASNVSNVSVVYDCYLSESSCDLTCMFGDRYVKGVAGKVKSSTLGDPEVAELCAKGHETSLLYGVWEALRVRWMGVCEYLKSRKDAMAMSFRYDPERRRVLCSVRIDVPIGCSLFIRDENLDGVVVPGFCVARKNESSSGSLEYRLEVTDREDLLTCSMMNGFEEKVLNLRVTDRTTPFPTSVSEESDLEDGRTERPAEPRTDPGAHFGLVVGLPCACLFALAIVFWRFWKRSSPCASDRLLERTSSRGAYRTTGANEREPRDSR